MNYEWFATNSIKGLILIYFLGVFVFYLFNKNKKIGQIKRLGLFAISVFFFLLCTYIYQQKVNMNSYTKEYNLTSLTLDTDGVYYRKNNFIIKPFDYVETKQLNQKLKGKLNEEDYLYDSVIVSRQYKNIFFNTYLKSLVTKNNEDIFNYNIKIINKTKKEKISGELKTEIKNNTLYYNLGSYYFLDKDDKLTELKNTENISLIILYNDTTIDEDGLINDYKIIVC